MAAEAGLTELNLLAPPAAPAGESGIIHARGGNYVSFLGSSDHFHLQTDRWPSAVDLDVVERYCVLVAGILEDVDRLPAILG
jgi:hypothetical protein